MNWYSRACCSYHDFLARELLLTRKPLNQKFLVVKLKLSLGMVYSYHHDGWTLRNICVTNDHGYVSRVVMSPSMTYHRVCNKSNTEGVTCLPFLGSSRFLVRFVLRDHDFFSFFPFSFDHSIVFTSLISGFWLPVWYLQTFLILCIYSLKFMLRTIFIFIILKRKR